MSKQQGSGKSAPRIGFGNYREVEKLMKRRDALVPYASGLLTAQVSSAALPSELRSVFDTAALVSILKADAARQVAAIDRQLEALGFDTSLQPE